MKVLFFSFTLFFLTYSCLSPSQKLGAPMPKVREKHQKSNIRSSKESKFIPQEKKIPQKVWEKDAPEIVFKPENEKEKKFLQRGKSKNPKKMVQLIIIKLPKKYNYILEDLEIRAKPKEQSAMIKIKGSEQGTRGLKQKKSVNTLFGKRKRGFVSLGTKISCANLSENPEIQRYIFKMICDFSKVEGETNYGVALSIRHKNTGLTKTYQIENIKDIS